MINFNRWLAPPAKIRRPYRDLKHRRLLGRPSLRHVRRNKNSPTQSCVNTEFLTAHPNPNRNHTLPGFVLGRHFGDADYDK